MAVLQSLVEWTQNTFLPYGPTGLFILAFIESSFFPIPPDLLLLVLAAAQPEQAFWLALITTIGSALGGLFGYSIGYVGKEAILKRFVKEAKIKRVHNLFNKYGGWAIFVAAFTPIPYKVFTIAAGVFYINIKSFFIASVMGRGLRFFIEAALIFFFGEKIIKFIDGSFNLYTLIAAAVIIIIVAFIKYKKKIKF